MDKKTALLAGLTNFLSRYRKVLAGVLIVIALGVVALVTVLTVQQNRRDASLEAVEELQRSYRDWTASAESEATEGVDALAEQAEAIIADYEGMYAAARASLILAAAMFELERWSDAAEQYSRTVTMSEGTYLGATATVGAAVSHENAGNSDRALELYRDLVDSYEEDSSYTPRALFNIGRIQEQQDSIAEAAEYYNRLVDDYPTSSWTNLARNRIITLTVEGRIGEE
jgi:tetratricopeptide (TPR) repeat protein